MCIIERMSFTQATNKIWGLPAYHRLLLLSHGAGPKGVSGCQEPRHELKDAAGEQRVFISWLLATNGTGLSHTMSEPGRDSTGYERGEAPLGIILVSED